MRNIDALLARKVLFEKYVSLQTHQLSAFHFSCLFLWQDFFDFEFEVMEEHLCIYAHQPRGCFLYLPPLGDSWGLSVVERAFSKMNKINAKTARIENVEQEQIPRGKGEFKIYPKSQEYVYRRQNLMELKGGAYKSQRHDINHFQAHHQALFRPYEERDFNACMGLYQRWAKNRHAKHEEPVYRSMLEENKSVHELALFYHKPLGLVGRIVESDQKVIAYSFGYPLNSQIFCVLLEIIDVGFRGLGAFIFNRFCADEALKSYALINTMDDFGLPYVATSKQAYHPFLTPLSHTLTQA